MARKRDTLWRNAQKLSAFIDRTKRATKAKLDLFEPLEILGYRSYGTPSSLRVIGRVVEQRGVEQSGGEASLFENIRNTIHRMESDEIPDARVRARHGSVEAERRTDQEGFFEIDLEPSSELEPGWHDVELTLMESMAGGAGITASAGIMVPPSDAEFGVISDLDDTVIKTQATDFLTQVRITFSRAPEERTAMPGASPLYAAMETGPDGAEWNPFFYVSRSGWGLHDLFETFLNVNGMPKGPILLQDIALVEEKSEQMGNDAHKRDEIAGIFDAFPNLQFVLIGDSGQEDPETYLEIVRHTPQHVRAVLIRDVTPPERDREVRRIMQEINDLGIPAAAAESSVSMARAAADFGLIAGEAIDAVREAMVQDEI